MSNDAATIILRPTRRKERLNGIEYRIYEGQTADGAVKLEMLGLFRVADKEQRIRFEMMVCAVDPNDPQPVTLLSGHGLVSP